VVIQIQPTPADNGQQILSRGGSLINPTKVCPVGIPGDAPQSQSTRQNGMRERFARHGTHRVRRGDDGLPNCHMDGFPERTKSALSGQLGHIPITGDDCQYVRGDREQCLPRSWHGRRYLRSQFGRGAERSAPPTGSFRVRRPRVARTKAGTESLCSATLRPMVNSPTGVAEEYA